MKTKKQMIEAGIREEVEIIIRNGMRREMWSEMGLAKYKDGSVENRTIAHVATHAHETATEVLAFLDQIEVESLGKEEE